jgi:hypothetical protein
MGVETVRLEGVQRLPEEERIQEPLVAELAVLVSIPHPLS